MENRIGIALRLVHGALSMRSHLRGLDPGKRYMTRPGAAGVASRGVRE